MLFIVGLRQLEREDKVALVAQLNCLTGTNVLGDAVQKAKNSVWKYVEEFKAEYHQGKMEYLEKRGWGPESKQPPESSSASAESNKQIDLKPGYLQDKIKEEVDRLSKESEETLDEELNQRLLQIANLKDDHSDTELACAIIHEAAKTQQIDTRIYAEASSLEGVVFEAAIKELIEALQKKLTAMSADEATNFEAILRKELNKLSQADQEAIKQSIGLEELSSQAITQFLKTASGTAIAQMIIGGFGFGAFLFLTTSIKAFSLLIGVTLPFTAYTAATSTLTFVLSFPFMLLVLGLTGGWMLQTTNKKIDSHLAKTLVMAGRSKLLSQPETEQNAC